MHVFETPAALVIRGARLTLALAVMAGIGMAQTPVFSSLYSFAGGSTGANPDGSLVGGTAGTLLGTTPYGGAFGFGTVYQLKKVAGTWTETVIYSFQGGAADGANPGAGLTKGAGGVYFGTCFDGGSTGNGTVFQLTPPTAGGAWTETVLYNFQGGSDGALPTSQLVVDKRGDIDGTTTNGGTAGAGAVFQLTPSAGGGYTEAIIYSFLGAKDGAFPQSGVTIGAHGELFGTTCCGSQGTIYKLSVLTGTWTKTTIFNFAKYATGAFPYGGVAIDANGVVYGTTSAGGSGGAGIVYSLAPPKAGTHAWRFTTIHSFTGGTDGGSPYGAALLGPGGVLYITVTAGGTFGSGALLQFTPPTGAGSWTEAPLYEFTGGNDGSQPFSGVIANAAGTLLGTTAFGGTSDYGSVYAVVP
jgi:hypothetical protein